MKSINNNYVTFLTEYNFEIYDIQTRIIFLLIAMLNILTLLTPHYFFQTPVGARLVFSMLLLGAELIFVKLPPGAGLFVDSEKRCDPLQAFMPVTK